MITAANIKRTEEEYSEMLGETVTIKFINETTYILGSELACLRAYKKFNDNKTISCGYSSYLETWYCSFTPLIYQ